MKRSSGGGAVVLFLGALALAVAVWLGLFSGQDDPTREASTAEATAPERAVGPADGSEKVAASGRRIVTGDAQDRALGSWSEFNKGAASGATVLDAPPDAGAAAAEFDKTGELSGALAELGPGAPVEEPDRPRFDVVRVSPDGSAVLAGRAAPGAKVQILIDGKPVETASVGRDGQFATFLPAPTEPGQKGGARRIDLSAKNPDGKVLGSREPVIVTMPATPGQAPVAMRPSRKGGYELLQSAEKEQETQVSIDAVTYGDKGEVVVTGRGKPEGTMRVYLDNTLKGVTKTDEKGDWSLTLEGEVRPARYRLRADQTEGGDKVTGRAETPFERAAPSDIRISEGAVIVQPGNNLWRIADYVYGDGARYTVIYGQNKSQIRDPDLIYPGQIFSLPKDG